MSARGREKQLIPSAIIRIKIRSKISMRMVDGPKEILQVNLRSRDIDKHSVFMRLGAFPRHRRSTCYCQASGRSGTGDWRAHTWIIGVVPRACNRRNPTCWDPSRKNLENVEHLNWPCLILGLINPLLVGELIRESSGSSARAKFRKCHLDALEWRGILQFHTLRTSSNHCLICKSLRLLFINHVFPSY